MLNSAVMNDIDGTVLSPLDQNVVDVIVEDPGASTSEIDQYNSVIHRMPILGRVFTKRKMIDRYHFTCLKCDHLEKRSEISRLVKHVRKCPKLDGEFKNEIKTTYRTILVNKNLTDGNSQKNSDWVEVMIENNMPLACVGSGSLKKFAKKYVPDWNLASRHRISDFYIPRQSEIIQNEFEDFFSNSPKLYLSVEFDHWRDANHRSLLGVIITRSNKKHLQDLVDVSAVGHRASVIVEQLKISLKSIPKDKINVIVSDSASACKLARRMITSEKEFSHVLQHRCMAHLLNLVGSNLSAKLKELMDWASAITAYTHAHPSILARLKREKITKVQKHSQVRWYSTVNMLEHLMNAKVVIVEELSLCKNMDQSLRFKDEILWDFAGEALIIFRPLANCIGQAELQNGSMGE